MAVNLLRLNQLLDMVEVTAHLDAAAAVRVLARLHDPERRSVLWVLLQNVVILRVVENLVEFLKLTVVLAFLDVVREWQRVVGVLSAGLQVDLHVVVDGLLVAQMEVVLLVVRRDHVVTSVVLLLLFLFIVIFLAFASVRIYSNFLKCLVSTRGDRCVRLFQSRQGRVFRPFRCRDQVLNRRVAFLVSCMGRHQAVALGPSIFLVSLGLFAGHFLVGLDLGENFIALPLGPEEVIVAPVVEVAHRPPKARLQSRSH